MAYVSDYRLELGVTYQYGEWVFTVVREAGPGGLPGSFDVLCLTSYSPQVPAGRLLEVTQNSAIAAYSRRVA